MVKLFQLLIDVLEPESRLHNGKPGLNVLRPESRKAERRATLVIIVSHVGVTNVASITIYCSTLSKRLDKTGC
jgi:hypothetical protein